MTDHSNTSIPKVALVTGAGSGIGRAASLALQAAGFHVVLSGRRAAELDETARRGSSAGPPMVAAPADVSNPDSVRELFRVVAAKFGHLDLLFNNAGTNVPATPLEDLTWEQWSTVVNVNLNGVFLCAQEAIRMMKAQEP